MFLFRKYINDVLKSEGFAVLFYNALHLGFANVVGLLGKTPELIGVIFLSQKGRHKLKKRSIRYNIIIIYTP